MEKLQYHPVRLYGVGEADPSHFTPPPVEINVPSEPALAEVLSEHMASSDNSDLHADPTVIKLDRNYEYSVWISYVEVYNEKVYDLLASVNDDQDHEVAGGSRSAPNVLGQGANPVIVTRRALAVKPCPAYDAMDDNGAATAGRYISGLKEFRVTSAAQAKSLVKLGQLHRRVFGTLANSRSSRSHSMITIKILRNHRGDRDVGLRFHHMASFHSTCARTRAQCKYHDSLLLIWLDRNGRSIPKQPVIDSRRRATSTSLSWFWGNAWRLVDVASNRPQFDPP